MHWVDTQPPSHLSVEIRMDGRRMGVLSHTKQSAKTSNGGFRVSIDTHCPYQFAPLETAGANHRPTCPTPSQPLSDAPQTTTISLQHIVMT